MNYTLRKINCKAFIGAVFAVALILLCSVRAYAAYNMRKIPNFWFDAKFVFVAENVSPRDSNLTYVTISYDSLADLVYYCNEHRLSTSLVYNSAMSKYVGFVNDTALDIKNFGVSSLHGLLGNVDGKVYVAERPETGGNTTTNNTYNFNQTIINNHNVGSGGSVITPSVSSSWSDRNLQEKIYQSVDTIRQMISITNGYLSNLGWIAIDIRNSIQQNVVPALDSINKNLISFKDSTVIGLGNLHTDLTAASDILQRQLDVENRIYSGVIGIGSRLDSVISNGAVQINATSLESRLDKLISMYSKVNSVVLDTASINGDRITGAVGGKLSFPVFWGNTSLDSSRFLSAQDISYMVTSTKGTETEQIANVPLHSVFLGSAAPAYIRTGADLKGGLWWDSVSGGYVLSDTYDASSGEYVQRVKSTAYDGTENWRMVDKDGSTKLFFCTDTAFENISANLSCWASDIGFTYAPFSAVFGGAATEGASAYAGQFSVWQRTIRFLSADYATVEAWKAHLAELAEAGTPLTVLFVPTAAVEKAALVSHDVLIPEGDSTLSSPFIRITGQYETYASFTQTADIIAAINNLQLSSGVSADLTAITTRLDTLINKTSDTVVNVVNNNTYITNVFQLDDDTSVVDTTKDGVGKVSGLFKWLWNNTFKGAFSHADIAKLDGLL